MQKSLKKFKALGNNTRLRILNILMAKGMFVSEIKEILSYSMSTISNHLQILTEAELVKSNKVGKCVIYAYDFNNIENHKFTSILAKMKNELYDRDKTESLKVVNDRR